MFGHVKARFPRIACNLDVKFGTEHKIITVCMALNNLCAKKSLKILEKWKEELQCLEGNLRLQRTRGSFALVDQPRTYLRQQVVEQDVTAAQNALVQ
jgi:hypothetical protein